ncbi:MAG: tripartite tricarboxylate transporter TctB family protein [Rubrivivax sp.]|nr:tripartite tricarboxylate transporter TctB family protein [Rubrivivax sp.]
MKLKAKSFFSLFLIFFFGVVIVGALGYNPKARLIPLVIALPCLAMAIAQFILDLGKGRKRGISGEEELFREVMEKVTHQEIVINEEKKEKKSSREARELFNSIFWILGFSALIFLFGFLIAIPVFTILFMRYKRESWWLSFSIAGGLWLSVYLSFVVAAKQTLYEGFIINFLMEMIQS